MKILKKIDILTAGEVLGLIGIVWGVVMAILAIALGSILIAIFPGVGAVVGVGIISLIIFPLTYGVIGFVSGIISALLYNIVANWIGGIKIDLK